MNPIERDLLIALHLAQCPPREYCARPDAVCSLDAARKWLRRWNDWGFYTFDTNLEDGRLTELGQTLAKELSACDM